MKATKAYIASLGATGALLAASVLMLAVVGAVVAFDGWPEGKVSTRVQTLLIDEGPAPLRLVSATADTTAHSDRAAPAVDRGPGASAPERQLVADRRLTGQAPAGGPGQHSPDAPAPAADTPAPIPQAVEDAGPIIDAISNPGTTATQIADGTQEVTGTAGGVLGQVSPEVGGVVATTGQLTGDVVRQVPLPDHILPGY